MAGFIEGNDRGQSVVFLIGWTTGSVRIASSALSISLSKKWICSVLVSPARPPRGPGGQVITLPCCSSSSSTATRTVCAVSIPLIQGAGADCAG